MPAVEFEEHDHGSAASEGRRVPRDDIAAIRRLLDGIGNLIAGATANPSPRQSTCTVIFQQQGVLATGSKARCRPRDDVSAIRGLLHGIARLVAAAAG